MQLTVTSLFWLFGSGLSTLCWSTSQDCQDNCMEVICVLVMRVKPQDSFSSSSIAKGPQNQKVLKVESNIFKSTW